MTIPHYDIIILGGGLAGLTLSLQIKQRLPDSNILVLERRRHPVPEAAFKIGESTVEIGAHYFSKVLDLQAHLQQNQLKKFGFRFFFSDGEKDIASVTELGASGFLPTSAYQIDRGRFENFLSERANERDISFIDGATLRSFELGQHEANHEVTYERAGETLQAHCRWLIDATGRAGVLKRQLNLAAPSEHNCNAVWFRISDRIDINQWSKDTAWLSRCDPPDRWLSTNHLMGEGYWVWLIPLASGSHSVGIVADAELHPIDQMNTFEKAMRWLSTHQPKLAEVLNSQREKLQDFAFFRRFSYSCKQVFSGEHRWALTGEAGFFLDPFYSPGSDFIAISNTYITELIALDQAGAPVDMYANLYEQIYFSLYRNMLPLYVGQYKIFGDPEVMPVKVLWDYTYYWGIMCQLFFQNRLTDVAAMGRMQKTLSQVQELNIAMQGFLSRWSECSHKRNRPRILDQSKLGWFAELNRSLNDSLDIPGFDKRINDVLKQLNSLAAEIVRHATANYPNLNGTDVLGLLTSKPLESGASMLFAEL